MNCPLCKDCDWFRDEGWKAYKEVWHDEALKEANEQAIILANKDEETCSLTWDELWLTHFNKLIPKILEKKKKDAISNYNNSVYQNQYPKDEIKNICSYHEEFY